MRGGAAPRRAEEPEDGALRHARLSQLKRFFERYNADPGFRRLFLRSPDEALAGTSPLVTAEEVRPFRGLAERMAGGLDPEELPPLVRAYARRTLERIERFDRVRAAAAPVDPRFRAWRLRRIAQAEDELGPRLARRLIFATGAFELSKGCSVGCWFCGVSAPKLDGHFRHTPAHQRLWREVLRVLVDLCGAEAVRPDFLFWATDPLDNPDYEAFAEDFHRVVGSYPSLTTALPLADPARTRRLLARMRETGADFCRFSVLSLPMLDRLHREFSPEELAGVELVLLNKEASLIKANAGRFRERSRSHPRLLEDERAKVHSPELFGGEGEEEGMPGTIACVAGLLVNLVEGGVRLVSPCPASERWPLGYVVHGGARFEDGPGFARAVEELVRRAMPLGLPADRPVRWRRGLGCRVQGAQLELGSLRRLRVAVPAGEAYALDLARRLDAGTCRPAEIGSALLLRHLVPAEQTAALLEGLFARGLLDEEPGGAAA